MTFPMAKEMADMIRILTGDETRIARYGAAFAVHRFTGSRWVNVGVTEWEIQERGPEKKLPQPAAVDFRIERMMQLIEPRRRYFS